MRRHPSRFLILALSVLAVSIALASCGDAASPPGADDPWAAVGPDLQTACEADGDGSSGEEARVDYCRCIVLEFSEFFGTPEQFAEAGGAAVDGDRPVDPRLQPAVDGCAAQYLR